MSAIATARESLLAQLEPLQREYAETKHQLDEIAEAKELILGKYNLMHVFAGLVKQAAAMPVSSPAGAKPRLILSERSLWPEEGARGGMGGTILRRGLQLIDPTIELRFRGVKKKIEARRIERRKQKRAKAEAGTG